MKKIYSGFIFSFILLSQSIVSHAQYATVPAGGNVSDPNTWVGMSQPTSPCLGCTIVLNGVVNIDVPIFAGPGATVTVSNGSTVNINAVSLFVNSSIIVSNNATVFVNDEVQLDGSNIRLSNTNSLIDASNLSLHPSTGTVFPGDPAGAGIYYAINGQGIPLPPDPATNYNFVISIFGYGDPNVVPLKTYSINCNASPPHACFPSVVYGPAILAGPPITADGLWEFVGAPPLPVVLAQFAASLNTDKTVSVTWATTEELNSDYFSIERSGDAKEWTSIGTVKSKGNSSGTVNYSFRDPAPLNPVNYYRLRMVDLDGKYKFSKVATVTMDGNSASMVVYSNPFKDQIRIKINIPSKELLELKVTDMQGKTYLQQNYNAQAGDNFINLTPANAASGVYVLSIRGKQLNQTIKLIKQ